MGARAALRLVERPSFFVEEGELWEETAQRNAHSLHYALTYPNQTPPELVEFALSKFSRRGDVVLDPFMGAGTTILQALLGGRVAYGSDVNRFFVKLARAKVQPADITEVTLRLQMLNLRRPVAIEDYRKGFESFYDIDTFREILGLRAYLQEHDDRVSRFIDLVALGLLHGHSAGFFSVYSFPHLSLSPDEQERINRKRAQSPDYRAVVPRILRKAAMVLRDGVPSVMVQQERPSRLAVRDARDRSHGPSGAVSLVLTSPPLPGARKTSVEQWLRLWFSGIEASEASAGEFASSEESDWKLFMNEALLEMARVTRTGSRAVLALREVPISASATWYPDDSLVKLVESELSRYWEAECLLVHQPKAARVQQQLRSRETVHAHRLLVLRRR